VSLFGMPNKADGNPDEANPSGDYLVWDDLLGHFGAKHISIRDRRNIAFLIDKITLPQNTITLSHVFRVYQRQYQISVHMALQ